MRGLKFGAGRVKLHDRAIEQVLEQSGTQRQLLGVADDISADVKASTSGSARLKQFGRKMVTDNIETGARAGTTWGPAVPVEFGTYQTPPLRILTDIASRHGRTK